MSAIESLNRLCKWRSVFAGWQLGTRLDTDAECCAVRDHREATILLRAEVSALTGLLLRAGVFTAEEWETALEQEAEQLSADFSERFPGMTPTDFGISMDLAVMQKHGTVDGWKL